MNGSPKSMETRAWAQSINAPSPSSTEGVAMKRVSRAHVWGVVRPVATRTHGAHRSPVLMATIEDPIRHACLCLARHPVRAGATFLSCLPRCRSVLFPGMLAALFIAIVAAAPPLTVVRVETPRVLVRDLLRLRAIPKSMASEIDQRVIGEIKVELCRRPAKL